MRIESDTVSWKRPEELPGTREVPPPQRVEFREAFTEPPVVTLSLSGFGLSNGGADKRVALLAKDVGRDGFTLVVDCNDRLDSVTASWLAYGS